MLMSSRANEIYLSVSKTAKGETTGKFWKATCILVHFDNFKHILIYLQHSFVVVQ